VTEEIREDLWGEIIRRYFENPDTLYAIRRADGLLEDDHSPEVYFAEADEFFPWEADNLAAVKGPILDIGSGPGRMMLWAQDVGFDIVGIESSPLTAAVARERGARDVRVGRWQDLDTLLTPQENRFGTVLLMGHNLGLAGTLSGLEELLGLVHDRTVPGACLLASSIAFSATDDPKHLRLQEQMRTEGRYPGEMTIRVEYGGRVGPYFPWLLVEPDDLARVGDSSGWFLEGIDQSEEGHYGVLMRRIN